MPIRYKASFTVRYNDGIKEKIINFFSMYENDITVDVNSADGYQITKIDTPYYMDDTYGMDIKQRLSTDFKDTKINNQHHQVTFYVDNSDLRYFSSNLRKAIIDIPITTEKAAAVDPTTILKVSYNNGVETVSDTFNNQKAGIVTGTATAGTGYTITGVTGAYYRIAGMAHNLENFNASKISDTKYTYSFSLTNDDIKHSTNGNLKVQLRVETEEQAIKLEPSINLKVTYNNGLTTITDIFNNQKAGTVTGTATAGKGYIITSVTGAYYNIVGELTSLKNFNAIKISDYKYSYSFSLTNSDIEKLSRFNTPIKLRVETEEQAGNIDIDTTGLVNCSVSPSTITQGKETVLTLNADTGYILNGSGSYIVDGKLSNFTCNNVASYQITITANSSVSISFTATKTEQKPTSIVHTYVLNQENYNNLGKQVIAGINSSGTAFEQYDYTKFVNYLYQFPFKIGNDITISTNTINLGKKNLTINCQKVTHETLDIDLGTIDLTDMTNSHDYKPINISLYCPFSNNIVLPLTVLGSKLNLSFTINLKSEQATLLITQHGNIIYSGQTELFTDLPLYFTAGLQDTLIKQFKTQYQNTIKQAYIIVSYNKPITNLTSYKTTEHGTLSSYKGFTRISRGTLKQSVSSSIDNSILSLLSQGVIIK